MTRTGTIARLLVAAGLVATAVVRAGGDGSAASGGCAPLDAADVEVRVANDIAYRRGLHFRADEAYVRDLYAQCVAPGPSGAAFTAAEATEEAVRTSVLPTAADLVEKALRAAGFADVNVLVSHRRGGFVVAQVTDRLAVARAVARAAVPGGLADRLDVVPMSHSLADLDRALARLDYSRIVPLVGTVHLAAVDQEQNAILLTVDDLAGAAAARPALEAIVGVRVVVASGAPEQPDHSTRRDDTGSPPHAAGHGILLTTTLIDGTPQGSRCTLAFSLRRNADGHNRGLTAGHCAGAGGGIHHGDHDSMVWIGHGGEVWDGGSIDAWTYSPRAGFALDPDVFLAWPQRHAVVGTDAGRERVGYNRRKSGATTSFGSGLLRYTNVDIDGSGQRYSAGWRCAGYNASGGDSGMPVWHNLNNQAYASGIHRGRVTVNGTQYGCYSHIRRVLDQGYSLRTR